MVGSRGQGGKGLGGGHDCGGGEGGQWGSRW